MNLKLVLQLSLFGLIMAFATVSLIPEKFEFLFWIFIFCFCAYVIAKVCTRKYFVHGFLLSIFNSVWITAIHLLFFGSYTAHHPDMVDMSEHTRYLNIHPHLYILILGVPSGIFFGLIQGLFAFITSKIVKPKVAAI